MTEPVGYREFVAANSRTLLTMAWLLCGDRNLAEDLVQITLVKVWPKWESLRLQETRAMYVRRVLFTTFVSWRRRRWTTELPTDAIGELAVDSRDAYAQADTREALRVALLDLSPRQRAVIVLRYFDDLTETQTAAVLGCSTGAVKRYAFIALKRLRAQPALTELRQEEVGP